MIDENATIATLKTSENSFAKSLVNQFDDRGYLSEKQWFWAVKIATEIENPTIVVTLAFASMIALFDIAAKALKFPKVRLQTESGELVCLGRSSNRSKAPGTITVTDGGPYGGNRYYGRVELDGTYKPTRRATPEIIDLLVRFSKNPAGVAAEYGKLTGNCCFCRHGLTDERSTSVGYGPVCAKNYSLPWG